MLEKVSYERLGIELDKMLEGNLPHKSVADLHSFDVLSIVYKFPDNVFPALDSETKQKLYESSVEMCYTLGELFETAKNERELFGEQLNYSKDLQMKTFYSALLEPFFKYSVPISGKQSKV